MRKVKLLALLLAVLMVVTAFAGCANTDVIESDVANLDERVTALENLLNGIDKELDDTNAKLEDTNKKLEDTNAKIEEVDSKIDKLDETLKGDKTDEEVAALKAQLDAQKASLDAQAKLLEEQTKTLQEQAKTAEAQKKAIEDQLKVLENQAAAQNKTNEELLATIQQMLKDQADKEAAEKAEAEAEKALNSAKTAALLQIAGIEGANPGKYILQIAIAKATVESASTIEAANKAVTDLNAAIEIAKGEEAAAAAAALAAAKETANTQITIIENANPGKYATEIANAKAAVEAATTTAEVTKAVTDLSAAIAKAEQDAADAAAAAAAAALKAAKDGALVEIAAVEAANAGKYADLFVAAKAAVEAATTAEAAAKAVTDLKAGVEAKKAAEAAAEAAKALKEAQDAASKEIALSAKELAADEKNYFVDDYKAIVKAIAAAETAVAAAETVEKVADAVKALDEELDKYTPVDKALYNYFVTLWGNLTEANRDTNTELRAFIKKAEAHYKEVKVSDTADLTKVEAVTKYVYDEDVDGTDLCVNLPAMFAVIDDVYTKGETYDGRVITPATSVSPEVLNLLVFKAADYDELTKDVEVYSLAAAAKQATALDQRIDAFVNNKAFEKANGNYYNYLVQTPSVATLFADIHGDYETWNKYVKPLAEENLDLITLKADVEKVKGMVDNYHAAEKALIDLGKYNYSDQKMENIFELNDWDSSYETNGRPFYFLDTKEYATDAIFAPINAAIKGWDDTYGLSDNDVTNIIEAKLAGIEYDGKYLVDYEHAELMNTKYETFKNKIPALVEALNEQDAIEVSAYKAYDALVKALSDFVNEKNKVVNEVNFDIMVLLSGVKADYDPNASYKAEDVKADLVDQGKSDNEIKDALDDLAANQRKDAFEIVTFDERYADKLITFFEGDYADYKTDYATPINNAIKALQDKFNARKLYNVNDILALRDEVVLLTTENVMVDRNNPVIAAAGYAEGTGYASITLPTGVTTSIYDFKDLCATKGYDGLAEVLVEEAKLDKLEADFNDRIAYLNENGAEQFKKELAEVKAVTLYTNASGYNRPTTVADYKLDSATGYDKVIYYVTLGDYAAFKEVYNVFENWVDVYGGNSAYQKLVDKTFKVSSNEFTGQVYQYILGDGAIEKYDNMQGQFKKLNEELAKVKTVFELVQKVNAYKAISDTKTNLESAKAITAKESSGDKRYTVVKPDLTGTTQLSKGTNPALGNSANTVSVWKLMDEAFKAYRAFELANQNLTVNDDDEIVVGSSELYIKNKEASTWKVVETASFAYIKAEVADWFNSNKSTAGTEDVDMAIADAVKRVLDAKKVYGMDAEAIEFSIEQFVNAYSTHTALNVTLDGLGEVLYGEDAKDDTIFDYAAKV